MHSPQGKSGAYFDPSEIDIKHFQEICEQVTRQADYPNAEQLLHNIVLYRGDVIREIIENPDREKQLKSEFVHCLKEGPGVFVIKEAYADLSVIDRCNEVFRTIVAKEKSENQSKGDHFGDNERIWNSLQKTCLIDPELFLDYYGNSILSSACEAWLGPHYRITAQMNNVRPGNKAQTAHRDYHLGFQSRQTISRYPAHAQIMSQFLTLQGAVAHCDMPIEMGPTLFLPFSQQFPAGYMAFRRPDFAEFFEKNKVQIPFSKGDAVFFNPALFHAGGSNSTNKDRVANLLQVSSPFGRTMETIDNDAMVEAVYPELLARVVADTLSEREIRDMIAAVAEGYSFPTNLDSDPPVGGNAPESGQQLLHRAISEQWPIEQLKIAIADYATRQQA
jgi:ectoine hydroxylase-related dioxygenase (phytanoyl-CoA dioxygenase family)